LAEIQLSHKKSATVRRGGGAYS